MLRKTFLGFALSFFLLSTLFVAPARAENYGLDSIEHSIVIRGSAEHVWDTIADFEGYGNWNEWMVKLEGEPEVGARLKGYAESGMHLDLEITSFEPMKEICWVDVTWFTKFGLGGWRCRSIEPMPNGKGILFVNHFQYTGAFGGVLEYFSRGFLEEGMQLENENLKAYIERR